MVNKEVKRDDFTGFTWKLFNVYMEVVFFRGRIITIAFNYKTRASKTFYLLDRGI